MAEVMLKKKWLLVSVLHGTKYYIHVHPSKDSRFHLWIKKKYKSLQPLLLLELSYYDKTGSEDS